MGDLPKIRSAYDGSRARVTVGGGETMVRQAFRDECDVNRIVARYATTGVLPVTRADAMYGDVSEVRNYKDALDFVNAARAQLGELPPRAQAEFEKDPIAFFNALQTAENRDDLVDVGLLDPIEKVPQEPIVEPPEPSPGS